MEKFIIRYFYHDTFQKKDEREMAVSAESLNNLRRRLVNDSKLWSKTGHLRIFKVVKPYKDSYIDLKGKKVEFINTEKFIGYLGAFQLYTKPKGTPVFSYHRSGFDPTDYEVDMKTGKLLKDMPSFKNHPITMRSSDTAWKPWDRRK